MPPVPQAGVVQNGCTVYSLTGFPGDGGGDWTKQQLDQLKTTYGPEYRALICSLNIGQTEARRALLEAGFKILAITLSAHQSTETMAQWVADGMPIDKDKFPADREYKPIVLMGKGFFPFGSPQPQPEPKPVPRKPTNWRKF